VGKIVGIDDGSEVGSVEEDELGNMIGRQVDGINVGETVGDMLGVTIGK